MKSTTRNAAIVLALMLPGAAFASSEQAWDQFAKDTQQKCTDATADIFRRSQVVVDPTGTQNYGVAIVFGRSKQAKGPAAVICVMDKKTGKAEIGSELGRDVVRVLRPKPAGQNNKPGKQQKQTNAQGQNKTTNTGDAASQDGDDDQQ